MPHSIPCRYISIALCIKYISIAHSQYQGADYEVNFILNAKVFCLFEDYLNIIIFKNNYTLNYILIN